MEGLDVGVGEVETKHDGLSSLYNIDETGAETNIST